jgi:formate hydrogenlyase subunit 3/multisubunit Na+/H+ antiporter MnhD subunit
VILAGVLLKMGGYGFIRFSVPLFPEATQYFAPLVFGLSIVAVIYTSLVALVQEDMKKLIAYSSVAHMGFVTIGVFIMNMQGVQGSIFQMLSHGIVSAALFLCVGVVYDRMHTREIDAYGGLVHRMPRYAFVFMFFTLASVGLPGLSGFVGEFLVLIGAFKANTWVAFLAATGLILGAAYALWLYRKIVFGELTKDSLKAITRHEHARDRGVPAAGADHPVDGHLSQFLPRSDGARRRQADRGLQRGAEARPHGGIAMSTEVAHRTRTLVARAARALPRGCRPALLLLYGVLRGEVATAFISVATAIALLATAVLLFRALSRGALLSPTLFITDRLTTTDERPWCWSARRSRC